MSMTKKQAKDKIEPLEKEMNEIEEDLKLVKSKHSVFALVQLLEHKKELLEMYKNHVGI